MSQRTKTPVDGDGQGSSLSRYLGHLQTCFSHGHSPQPQDQTRLIIAPSLTHGAVAEWTNVQDTAVKYGLRIEHRFPFV